MNCLLKNALKLCKKCSENSAHLLHNFSKFHRISAHSAPFLHHFNTFGAFLTKYCTETELTSRPGLRLT